MFDALAEAGINIGIISTSSVRISCVVPLADVERAVQAVHERFALHEPGRGGRGRVGRASARPLGRAVRAQDVRHAALEVLEDREGHPVDDRRPVQRVHGLRAPFAR